jgi:hypothetical protein
MHKIMRGGRTASGSAAQMQPVVTYYQIVDRAPAGIEVHTCSVARASLDAMWKNDVALA